MSAPVTLDRIGVSVPAVRPPAPVTASCAAPAKATATATAVSTKPTGPAPKRPFVSGFCGAGPVCLDIRGKCKGMFDNGPTAPIPTLVCSCSCHPFAKNGTASTL